MSKQPDAIFRAIDTHRRAEAALEEILLQQCDWQEAHRDRDGGLRDNPELEGAEDCASDAEQAAWRALLATVPTTAHGLRALLSYLLDSSVLEAGFTAEETATLIHTIRQSPALAA